MSLLPGTTLGNYQVTGLLGKGGMGEVYRARDLKLKRDVAIKVLPSNVSRDPERLARFQREAEALAALNHPNIGAIHGFEESDETGALVLEFVEGETLAERLRHGPIPIDQVVSLGRQICDALEAAHEKGIAHRDLKPANIKITPEGKVKLLDFGLARVFEEEPSGDASNSPTLMSQPSAGVIIGTAAYMSPEQARGRPVDKRADIWAFGCVLYEMLTGRPTFRGESVTDILAAVVSADPDWQALPDHTPAGIRTVLRRCLQKDSARRVRDIADVRLELEEMAVAGVEQHHDNARPSLMSRRREWIAWGAAALALLIAGVVRMGSGSRQAVTPPTWLSIFPPYKEFASSAAPAISPDGRRIAFWAQNQAGRTQLWIRSLDSTEARALPGTESEGQSFQQPPFWSPDEKSLGFFLQNKLKRIDVDSGGSPLELADVALGRGGSWGESGIIIYIPGLSSSIHTIPASGGSPSVLPPLELKTGKASYCTDLNFLPDARHFFVFCTADSGEESGVYIGSLDGGKAAPLPGIASTAVYAAGYVFFGRGNDLLAQKFDIQKLELQGEPIRVAQDLGFAGSGLAARAVTVSPSGSLAIWTGRSQILTDLAWFDRQGQRLQTVGEPAERIGLILAPDEKQVVFEFHDLQLNWIDLMRLDLSTGIGSRLTTRAGGIFGFGANSPVWSPDGRKVLFMDNTLRWTLQDVVTNQTETVFRGSGVIWFMDWSADGKHVVYQDDDPAMGRDLWVFPITGDRKPRKYMTSPHTEMQARVSPDSRWLAYSSNESGRFEVYIDSFPNTGRKIGVSRNGGTRPMWRRDGKELFYISADNKLMALPVSLLESGLAVRGAPEPLFTSPLTGSEDSGRPQYFPTALGDRFLFNVRSEDPRRRAIHVLLNWPAVVAGM